MIIPYICLSFIYRIIITITIVFGLLLVHMRTLAKYDFTAVWLKSVTNSVCLRTYVQYRTSTQTYVVHSLV